MFLNEESGSKLCITTRAHHNVSLTSGKDISLETPTPLMSHCFSEFECPTPIVSVENRGRTLASHKMQLIFSMYFDVHS